MTQTSQLAARSAVLAQQVRWQHPTIAQAGIDQTRLAIADAPTEARPFSFLVMGDTDAGMTNHPTETSAFADGFARQLMAHLGESRFLLHTGDVTYPMGTYQNYLSGFFQPYQSLLSHLPKRACYQGDSIVFNRALLPVPGNHDYADLQGMTRTWQGFLRFVCDQLRDRLGIDLGHYGGQGGEAYGQAFLDDIAKLTPEQMKAHLIHHYSVPLNDSARFSVSGHHGDPAVRHCLSYRPGQFTRLPNRYYTFRYAGVDFFALDSNTWNRSPDTEGFDHEQLSWLAQVLIRSWQTPNTVGRIIYLHHSAYTTEETRWQNSDTLWVRRHLRSTLNKVAADCGHATEPLSPSLGTPLVDLVISGHAHCLEYVRTANTGHADAYTDWMVCGGSGMGLRRQRKNETDILENISFRGRSDTKVVAKSQFYAGVHGHGAKKQNFYSFMQIKIQPQRPQKIKILPFVVVKKRRNWQTKALDEIVIGKATSRMIAS